MSTTKGGRGPGVSQGGPASPRGCPCPSLPGRRSWAPTWPLQGRISRLAEPRQSQDAGADVTHGVAGLCSREFGRVHTQPVAPVVAGTENREALRVWAGAPQGSKPPTPVPG